MQDLDFCKQVLGLSDPWQVEAVEVDQPSSRLDIYVGFGGGGKKGLFGGGGQNMCPQCHTELPRTGDYEAITLRHLPLAGLRTYLHVPPSGVVQSDQPDCICMQDWMASSTKFTQAMQDHVAQALQNAPTNQIAAKLAGVSSSEAREVSDATGIVPAGHETEPDTAAAAAADMSAGHEFAIEASGNVPGASHSGWQRLIKGELPIQTDSVALRMLLQRVRSNLEKDPSQQTRLAGAQALRQFFIKNQQLLKREIDMLTADESAYSGRAETATAAAAQALPSERDPVWQQLISGDISIESDVISLKMLLERVRQAVDRNPTEGNRVAAAKILRQYFAKNRHKHAGEIGQLQAGASAASAHAAVTAESLPSDNHPNWQRLINGEIALHTDAVSLKMLLERIRQAIARKPTEANRLAGARMLRQYFIKNQHRHAAEIAALAGAEPATHQHTAADDVHSGTIPGIEHPSWQRLINGELQIMTDAVGLKMMLERIRLSIENNPSEASRLAGAKILRQYFIKHQSKHRAELEQLRAA